MVSLPARVDPAVADFARDGAGLIRAAVVGEDLRQLIDALDDCGAQPGVRGFRVAAAVRACLAPDGALGRIAKRFAGCEMQPVRVLLFDKTAHNNWAVPWHQDRVIAVRERADVAGFARWSVKEGVVHVEPPQTLLARMLTLRLLLDDCAAANAPLQLVPGSHGLGRIAVADIASVVRESAHVCATGAAGDVLAMRLLTVHRSARASVPSRRRVLHVDYAADDLPPPLQWHFDPASDE